MNAVLLNGADHDDSFLPNVARIVETTVRDNGYSIQSFILKDMQIAYCQGCFGCWVKSPGLCVIDDAGRDIASAVVNSDVTIWLSPIRFGCFNSTLKKAIDRLVCLISPFFMKQKGLLRKKPRYASYPILVCLGSLPEPDKESEEIFALLVERNALSLHAPIHMHAVLYESLSEEELCTEITHVLHQAGGAP
jgi:multimeric flavodoxin WrbA